MFQEARQYKEVLSLLYTDSWKSEKIHNKGGGGGNFTETSSEDSICNNLIAGCCKGIFLNFHVTFNRNFEFKHGELVPNLH